MTTVTGLPDFSYKVGVRDLVNVRLKQNGSGINLTGVTLTFNIKDVDDPTNRIEVPCIVGGSVTVNGTEYTEVDGGCQINFGNSDLSTDGQYHGEFVGIKDGSIWFKEPYNDNYYILMVYPGV